MIDLSHKGAWAEALQPDRRSLKFLTEAEIHAPDILDRIQRWHGCTMAEALAMKGAECRRRTTTTDYAKGA